MGWKVAAAIALAGMATATATAQVGEGGTYKADGVANIKCSSRVLTGPAGTKASEAYTYHMWIFVKGGVALQLKEACRRESGRAPNDSLTFVASSFSGEVTRYCAGGTIESCSKSAG